MLEETIDPLIKEELEIQRNMFGTEIINEELRYFQQDGARPLYAKTVRGLLNNR